MSAKVGAASLCRTVPIRAVAACHSARDACVAWPSGAGAEIELFKVHSLHFRSPLGRRRVVERTLRVPFGWARVTSVAGFEEVFGDCNLVEAV